MGTRLREQQTAYAALWLFALAFGGIEASTVAYLREIHLGVTASDQARSFSGVPMTLIALPDRLVALEMMREGCTVVLLGAVAWLAGHRPAQRAGAFLLSFGIWDLAYYATLRLVSGWPQSLRTWDVLFLLPLPWVAPVWAPAAVAALLIAAGSYFLWTAERERHYGWLDIGVLAAAAAAVIASFLAGSASAINRIEPERFPVWLYAAGVIVGIFWFVRTERRTATGGPAKRPWFGVRMRTILPQSSRSMADRKGIGNVRAPSKAHDRISADHVAGEYEDATRRLDALAREAADLGERLERVARGLSEHPARMIIGFPARFIEHPGEWDVVPDHPLPSIERLAALTDAIREVSAEVADLRERLILMGRTDVVQPSYRFFR